MKIKSIQGFHGCSYLSVTSSVQLTNDLSTYYILYLDCCFNKNLTTKTKDRLLCCLSLSFCQITIEILFNNRVDISDGKQSDFFISKNNT